MSSMTSQLGWDESGRTIRKRLTSWKAILIEKTKEIWNLRTDLTEEDRNKLIIAETIREGAELESLVENIQKAPTKEMGYKLLATFFAQKGPSVETLARGLRDGKVNLRENHPDFMIAPDSAKEKDQTYDELLVEIDRCTTERDSSLESNFGIFLNQHLPNVYFNHNCTVRNGSGVLNVDFVARQYGLVVEIDGYEFHRDLHSFIEDRQRWRKLREWGYDILVFAGTELTIEGGFYNALDVIKWWIDKKS